MKLITTLALLAVLFCYANAQSCSASLNATRQATWVDGQTQPRSLWTVVITAGQLQVSDVVLSIPGPLQQIWEVDPLGNGLFHLPAWRIQAGGIPAGQSHVFGFIINNNSTSSPVTIVSVSCPGVSPSPSPSASPSASRSPSASPSASGSPSPSASPSRGATPTASASASPSASRSPSPSPRGPCSLSATQVARSGAGGSWTDNSFRFQIYDITLQNTGSQPISQASITINFASDQQITEFWNLRRVDATNEFFIESSVLPAPGQTQMGLGYILRTPLNSTSDGSSIGSVEATC